MQEGIHFNLRFPFVGKPRILISSDASSHRAFDYGQAKTGSPSPQLKGPDQVWESMVEMSKKV